MSDFTFFGSNKVGSITMKEYADLAGGECVVP